MKATFKIFDFKTGEHERNIEADADLVSRLSVETSDTEFSANRIPELSDMGEQLVCAYRK